MHRLCFTREKFFAGNFSFARAFRCLFFFHRLWEKCVDVLGEKRLEIGTTHDFLLFLQLSFMQDLCSSYPAIRTVSSFIDQVAYTRRRNGGTK